MAQTFPQFQNDLQFAKDLDAQDTLKHFRELFYFPQFNGKDSIYFTGNSLGLQPKSTRSFIEQELKDWETFGVDWMCK